MTTQKRDDPDEYVESPGFQTTVSDYDAQETVLRKDTRV